MLAMDQVHSVALMTSLSAPSHSAVSVTQVFPLSTYTKYSVTGDPCSSAVERAVQSRTMSVPEIEVVGAATASGATAAKTDRVVEVAPVPT